MGEYRAQRETKNCAEDEAKDRLAECIEAGIGEDAQQKQFAISPRRLQEGFRNHLQMRQIEIVEDLHVEEREAARLVQEARLGEVAGHRANPPAEYIPHRRRPRPIVGADGEAQPPGKDRTNRHEKDALAFVELRQVAQVLIGQRAAVVVFIRRMRRHEIVQVFAIGDNIIQRAVAQGL